MTVTPAEQEILDHIQSVVLSFENGAINIIGLRLGLYKCIVECAELQEGTYKSKVVQYQKPTQHCTCGNKFCPHCSACLECGPMGRGVTGP
jgi:hypothetical protein